MSEAILGAGTKLSYADTVSGSFVEVAELLDLPMPEYSAAKVKATHMGSPNLTHEYIPGFAETSDYQFNCNYVAESRAALKEIKNVPKFWKITYPDGATETFPGYLNSISGQIPVEDRITMVGTITVTGDSTYTEPASS